MQARRSFTAIAVDPIKLRDYCLSVEHPRGRHKARVFRSRLGLTAGNSEILRIALLDAARIHRGALIPTDTDAYGQRFVLDFAMTTEAGTAVIRSGWIVSTGDQTLRFVTCYVLD
jgi:hypothetical protein